MPSDAAAAVAPVALPVPGQRQWLATRAHAWRLLPLMRTVRGWFRRDLRVLAYHRVRDPGDGFAFDRELVSASPEAFHGQMAHLRDRFHPVTCREVVAALDGGAALPRDAVLVTFDDGYDDNHAIAFPILRETGVPATFFVATGHIDSGLPYAYDWLAHLVLTSRADRLRLPGLGFDAPLPALPAERRALVVELLDRLKYLDDAGQQAVIAELELDCRRPRTAGHVDCQPMTWDQLREMQAGGMEIGGHGVHHRMLAKLPGHALRAEVAECQARLTAELGKPAIAFSYPVGGPDAYDARVVDAVREQGFRIGFTYVSGASVPRAGMRYEFLRTGIEANIDAAWFEGMLALPEVFAHRTRLRTYPA